MLLNSFPDRAEFCSMSEEFNVVPLCREILADMETPVSLLKKFNSPDSQIFLFESVEGGERWGRYSFLGTSAMADIRIYREEVEIVERGKTRRLPHGGDPLSVLRDIMEMYRPPDMPQLPRFWGGLVGYLTYEMISFFEKIRHRLPEDTPFAHFIIPDEIIIFDNIKNSLTCIAITFTDRDTTPEKAYIEAVKRLEAMTEKISAQPAPLEKKSKKPDLVLRPEETRQNYIDHVRTIKDHIYKGDVIQTVLSQEFGCDAPDDITELYRAQRYINPSPYLFFLKLDSLALVGSSPETMVRLEKGTATLRPIAGTRPRGNSQQEDRALADELLADEKEKAEHLMLVDLGRNDLGRVAETGTVQVTDLMVVERYSHVMHLVSNIICDIKEDNDAYHLLRATFPAGTLSGAPKVRAMEIISDLEEKPRGAYGGAVGYISFNGNMDLAITIRTAAVEKDRLKVRAGAGIVYDSDPEKEHEECINKAKAIEKALALLGEKTK